MIQSDTRYVSYIIIYTFSSCHRNHGNSNKPISCPSTLRHSQTSGMYHIYIHSPPVIETMEIATNPPPAPWHYDTVRHQVCIIYNYIHSPPVIETMEIATNPLLFLPLDTMTQSDTRYVSCILNYYNYIHSPPVIETIQIATHPSPAPWHYHTVRHQVCIIIYILLQS